MNTDFQPNQPAPDRTDVFASPGGRDLVLDAYPPHAPDCEGPHPAIVFVHGGGWNGGKREQFLWHAHRLSQRGYFACTIDYRLSDEAMWPAQLDDCQAAVRWLREHAEELHIDASRIGAIGSSAGGHLAACLGVRDRADIDGHTSTRPNCVVDIHGIHDTTLRPDWPSQVKLLGEYEQTRDLWLDASPIRFVDRHTPPMLLTHDPDDPIVPYDQSVIMCTALAGAGIAFEFLPTPSSKHGFAYNPQNEWAQRIWPIVVAFLDRHLQP